jgi:hypothetical protein
MVDERSTTRSRDLIVQQKAHTDMARILMTSFMLAASIVVLTSQSNAQSPDPALLAPGQSGTHVGAAISRVTTELRLRGAS